MPTAPAWPAELRDRAAHPVEKFPTDPRQAIWLPNAAVAKAWERYVVDTNIPDFTPPPAPSHIQVDGNRLSWAAVADLASGLAGFLVFRDGTEIARLPAQPKNPFGRPLFPGLHYSDTPTFPLIPMTYTDATANPGQRHTYRIVALTRPG